MINKVLLHIIIFIIGIALFWIPRYFIVYYPEKHRFKKQIKEEEKLMKNGTKEDWERYYNKYPPKPDCT